MKLNLWCCEECGALYAFGKFEGPRDNLVRDDEGNLEQDATGLCRVCNTIAVKFLVYVDL